MASKLKDTILGAAFAIGISLVMFTILTLAAFFHVEFLEPLLEVIQEHKMQQ